MSYWMYHLITNTKINILRFEEILRPCYDIITICYENHHKLSVSEKNSVPFSLFLLRNFNIVNLKLFLTLRWIMFLDMSLWNSVFKSCFWFWTLEEYCLIMIIIVPVATRTGTSKYRRPCVPACLCTSVLTLMIQLLRDPWMGFVQTL